MYDQIKNVIDTAIAGTTAAPYARQYASAIEKVAADVAAHVSKCGEDAIEAAVEKYDVDADEARALLVEAGLAVERTPEVAQPEDPARDERLSTIERKVDALIALAERHLGRVNV